MNLKTKELILCSIFAALTAILAQISIPLPITTTPFTLQIFAVAMTGLILGSKCGFISILIYLLLGAIGIPVFANFSGGAAVLLGPTGGYLLGFPIMSFIIGYIKEKTASKIVVILGMMLGLILDYTTGTLIFSILTGNTIYQSIIYCVAPFIITDLIKIGFAYIIGSSVSKRVSSSLHLAN